ncbi:hypothetical protein ACTWPT_08105 [Nonomuraea sp. 3N208]|uniref:hypothetical protein n=1 Tax=Nonomuraea sp. 3N208 TaxID=3457421 RepID=UPI003FCDAF99
MIIHLSDHPGQMILIDAVLENGGTADFTAWPVAEPFQNRFLSDQRETGLK